MITNSSMTLYHKVFNTTTRLDTWVRYNYNDVMFQGGKGAGLNKGYENANDVKIRIPYNKNTISISNIEIGDIVVKGTLTLEITKQSDLNSYETFNIVSIKDNNFGGERIRHIHLEGK